ncbi:HEPN domain-containing protein [Bacteroides sp.]
MKNSIAYLPKNKQEDLYCILRLIRKYLPQAEMVILFGSYARNTYVDFDERVEFGVPMLYRSDYDILVVTSKISDFTVDKALMIVDKKYDPRGDSRTPIQFIHDNIKKVNSDLSEGRYFYNEIKRDGVMLYDSGKFKLKRRRKLRFDEIKQQAEEYYEDKFGRSTDFFETIEHAYNRKRFQLASFLLHQACENAYVTIRLVHTLKSSKLHDLEKLSRIASQYSGDLMKVFPRNTDEEKRLFELIKAAYIEGRYNPKFLVTKEDIDTLIPKVELLREITQRICKERIEYYAQQAAK